MQQTTKDGKLFWRAQEGDEVQFGNMLAIEFGGMLCVKQQDAIESLKPAKGTERYQISYKDSEKFVSASGNSETAWREAIWKLIPVTQNGMNVESFNKAIVFLSSLGYRCRLVNKKPLYVIRDKFNKADIVGESPQSVWQMFRKEHGDILVEGMRTEDTAKAYGYYMCEESLDE